MTGSNSQAVFDALVERFKDCLDRGGRQGMASLAAYRDAGVALQELKALVPHGEFGRVADELCGNSKQWRACLMKLARDWENIEAAIRWAEEAGRSLGAKAYSVDGALALLKEWRRAQNPGAHSAKPRCRPAKARTAISVRGDVELIHRLHAARAYGIGWEQRAAAKDMSEPERVRQNLSPECREKARKLAALWHRGGTAAESAAALNKLFDVAARLGWTLPALLRECAIESPADWTFDERLRVSS
jgi:hypothetical protein